jgi:hypothetical protein
MTRFLTSDAIFKELASIQKEAPEYGEGVKTFAHYIPQENFIVIEYIYVPVPLRRRGIASEILDEYVTLSDACLVPLKLLPVPELGTPYDALEKLYSMAGFKHLKEVSSYFIYKPH